MRHFVRHWLVSRLAIAVLSAIGIYETYRVFAPGEDPLGLMKAHLADRVIAVAVDDFPKRAELNSIAVLDLAGDPTGAITSGMRSRVDRTGKYELISESFFRKLMREAPDNRAPVRTLNDAVAVARRLGVDAVVFGEVTEFVATETGASLSLDLRIADRESGHAVFAKTYREKIGGSHVGGAYWRARVAGSSPWRRILLWLSFALVLPIAMAPLIRRLTSQDSNAVNLLMLIGFTIVDVLAALLLTGFWVATFWTAAILAFGAITAAYYNYRVAVFIDEMAR